MVGRGAAPIAVVAVVAVVLVGATVFGYFLLVPGTPRSTATLVQTIPSVSETTPATNSTARGTLTISNAAIANGSILVTVQNTGSQAVSISSLLVTPGSGCLAFANRTTTSTSTSSTSQNRSGFAPPGCFSSAAVFLVQTNSTLKPVPLGRFNFTRLFNSTVFSRSSSGNVSSTTSGNFSQPFPGNFSAGFPGGFLGNLSGTGGFQLAAGQAVTLAYIGPFGSGVTTGSQYTITIAGLQGDAQITIRAS